ncbi:MAG TPA: hypothetical protein VJ201_07440 [Candidatus Babeliales bacterium]|nr:hypothetical protein [Candidatus Babeliales bacterium]HLC07499.1 hypothetical protein [Candidatus Babeliales bacterium]
MIVTKNTILYLYILCCISFPFLAHGKLSFFSKVIIWGHPLHSHTHSYIHEGFYRAFKHLGYEVYWVKNQDEMQHVDLHNALFITEGQVDGEMPKRQDCYYIVHNWNSDNYQELFNNNRCILLQVYTDDCLPYAPEKLGDCIYCNSKEKMIFMPWATDLLPHEIERVKQHRIKDNQRSIISWVGTIGGGRFGNQVELAGFKKACRENDVVFNHKINVSREENIDLIATSYMAPAIQGPYQCEKGYIPCRIFKNISYGQWGVTNNKIVYDLFKGKVVYNPDTYQLFYDAKAHIDNTPISELYELMDFVKNNHTYINRIEMLLTFMQRALNIKEENEVK